MRIQPIHHTFGPHVSRKYALHADRLLLCPWKWKRETHQTALREALSHKFDASAHLFGSGREALLALLRSLQFEQGAEVIIQGFTCVALPNAIHAAGYTPVYADIDVCTLNMNLDAVQGRINNRTRAIICQHTFGIPADTAGLRKLCDQHNLVLIEDCAHVIPDNLGPKEIGENSEYILLSFGRDKAISGVVGGAILSRKKETTMSLQKEEEHATPPSRSTVLRALLYPALYHKGRMVYGLLSIGKTLLFVAGKLQLLLPVLTGAEKQGVMSPLIHKMPEPCAALALAGLSALQETNNHRRMLTKNYAVYAQKNGWNIPVECAELPLQKFPLLVPQADTLRKKLKQQTIYLDDSWTGAVVCPRTVDQEATNYMAGSCPHAERVAQTIFTLPTHPTMKEKQANSLLSLLTSLLA
jgi:perosamine synthetase